MFFQSIFSFGLMSALGQKQTLLTTTFDVRFTPESGHKSG